MIETYYHDNAYRVLGMPSNSSHNEIRNAMQSLRVRAKAGGLNSMDEVLSFMEIPERTEISIRDAYNKLENPQSRIRERLFWFSCSTPADHKALNLLKKKNLNSARKIWGSMNNVRAIANQAILYHSYSIAKYPYAEKSEFWKNAIGKWVNVLEKDEFWEQIIDVEMKSGFETFATVSDIEALRNEAIELVLQPSAICFERAITEKKLDDAKRHLEIIRSNGFQLGIYSRFEAKICEPLEDQIKSKLEDIFSIPANDIKNENISPKEIKTLCDKAYEGYLIEIPNKIKKLEDIFGEGSETVKRIKEKSADRLRDLSIKYHNDANAFQIAERILLEAISLIPGSYRSELWKNEDLPKLEQHAKEEANRLLLEPILSISHTIIDQLTTAVDIYKTGNKDACDRAYNRFQAELLPKIKRLSLGSVADEAREIGVFCLRQISVHYHNDAGLFEMSEKILKEAFNLTRNNETIAALNQELEVIKKSICQNIMSKFSEFIDKIKTDMIGLGKSIKEGNFKSKGSGVACQLYNEFIKTAIKLCDSDIGLLPFQYIRSLGIEMANKFSLEQAAMILTETLIDLLSSEEKCFKDDAGRFFSFKERINLKSLFSDIAPDDKLHEFMKTLKEDKKVLGNIITQKYIDIYIGQDHIIINPDVITFNKKQIRVDDVTRVRWGIKSQSTIYTSGGIESSYWYTIWIGSNVMPIKIECIHYKDQRPPVEAEERYKLILNVLWNSVCSRLIREALQKISSGQKFYCGDVSVDSDGVLLHKSNLLIFKEYNRCRWEDLQIRSAEGSFIMQSRNDKKINAKLSYRDIDNVHIFEAVVRSILEEKGYLSKADMDRDEWTWITKYGF